jgi:hypothetical protein
MNTPTEIFKEYERLRNFKLSLGEKGIYEQNIINRRFFYGDQWYGAGLSGERPLVRHNVIKRVGEYKIGRLLKDDYRINLCVKGINYTNKQLSDLNLACKNASNGEIEFLKTADENEKRLLSKVLTDYFYVTFDRLKLSEKITSAIKNSFITGSGIIYTYWDPFLEDGSGDIACEVLPIENVYFGDEKEETVEKQPFIIVASRITLQEAKETAAKYGLKDIRIAPDYNDGKVLLLTKLYKQNGKVMAVSVTEKAVIRKEYCTNLNRYPISLFSWDKKEDCIYSDSEITYLIPNQIAINRLLSANVWSTMYMGMPIMTVNGDTVTEDITNDPGQIIRVYGTNEDVAGAVHYVSPPDFSNGFNISVANLIDSTLESSGANMTAIDKISAGNTTAVEALNDSQKISALSLSLSYKGFLEDIALVFVNFWLNKYGKRDILVNDDNGCWHFPFDASRYTNLSFYSKAILKEEKQNESH